MERAQAWLKRYGRPLEMALWDFHFAGGSKENVIRYLSAFQNEDGVSAMGWNRISGFPNRHLWRVGWRVRSSWRSRPI